ncbi:hypothetical protein B0H13DRAFT_2650815 [Mycena leptocephala]|nr:hypothetical protein B0H13DRAFT_2650815 [Mycena leptocephala]
MAFASIAPSANEACLRPEKRPSQRRNMSNARKAPLCAPGSLSTVPLTSAPPRSASSSPPMSPPCDTAPHLLGISPEDVEMALTNRTVYVRKELLEEYQAAAQCPTSHATSTPSSLLESASSSRPTPPPSPCSTRVSVSHAIFADADDAVVGNNACTELSDASPSPNAWSSRRRRLRRNRSSVCSAADPASLALKSGKNGCDRNEMVFVASPHTAPSGPHRSPYPGNLPARIWGLALRGSPPFAGMLFRGPSLAVETHAHARDASRVVQAFLHKSSSRPPILIPPFLSPTLVPHTPSSPPLPPHAPLPPPLLCATAGLNAELSAWMALTEARVDSGSHARSEPAERSARLRGVRAC